MRGTFWKSRNIALLIALACSLAAIPAYGVQAWTYTIKPGDSLYLIARRVGVSVSDLRRANGIWTDNIEAGARLNIPTGAPDVSPAPTAPPSQGSTTGTYTVRSGDTLYFIAQRIGTSVSELRRLNNLWSDYLAVGQVLRLPGSSRPTSPPPTGGSPASPPPSGYRPVDRDLLARLVYAEAAGEPFEGQVAVAATVLNRMRSSRYPDTVPGVVYEIVDGKYQYSPVLDGRINNTPNATAYQAVDAALAGRDPSNGATGFYNPDKVAWSSWVRQHPITTRIGNHVFFKY